MGGNIYHLTWHQDKWPLISNCDTGFSVVPRSSVMLHMQVHRERELWIITKYEPT